MIVIPCSSHDSTKDQVTSCLAVPGVKGPGGLPLASGRNRLAYTITRSHPMHTLAVRRGPRERTSRRAHLMYPRGKECCTKQGSSLPQIMHSASPRSYVPFCSKGRILYVMLQGYQVCPEFALSLP